MGGDPAHPTHPALLGSRAGAFDFFLNPLCPLKSVRLYNIHRSVGPPLADETTVGGSACWRRGVASHFPRHGSSRLASVALGCSIYTWCRVFVFFFATMHIFPNNQVRCQWHAGGVQSAPFITSM